MSRNYSSTAVATTLSAGCTAVATTISVTATAGFPAAPFILALDAGAATQELVLVTAVSGTNLTVTRGYDSTTAQTHDTGAAVQHTHAAIDFRESRAHESATTGVHGTSGALVGTSGAQTLTDKSISVDTNTIDGVAPSSFVLSDATGKLDGAAAAKAVPAGPVAGTTDAQALTNKDLTSATNTFPAAHLTDSSTHTVTNKDLSSGTNKFPPAANWLQRQADGTQTLGTLARVKFDGTSVGSGVTWDSVNHEAEIVTAGLYRVDTQVDTSFAGIYKNGVRMISTSSAGASVFWVGSFAVGDTIHVEAAEGADGSSSVLLSAIETSIAIVRLT